MLSKLLQSHVALIAVTRAAHDQAVAIGQFAASASRDNMLACRAPSSANYHCHAAVGAGLAVIVGQRKQLYIFSVKHPAKLRLFWYRRSASEHSFAQSDEPIHAAYDKRPAHDFLQIW